jgi:hypothetical protein
VEKDGDKEPDFGVLLVTRALLPQDGGGGIGRFMPKSPIDAFDPSQVRAFVAIQVLGLSVALEEGVIDGQDASRWLFRSGMLPRLEAAGACKGCLHLVGLGTELCAQEHANDEQIQALKAGALAVLRGVKASN